MEFRIANPPQHYCALRNRSTSHADGQRRSPPSRASFLKLAPTRSLHGSLMEPNRLRTCMLLWAEEMRLGALPPKAGAVLEAILYRSELPRGRKHPRAHAPTRAAHCV